MDSFRNVLHKIRRHTFSSQRDKRMERTSEFAVHLARVAVTQPMTRQRKGVDQEQVDRLTDGLDGLLQKEKAFSGDGRQIAAPRQKSDSPENRSGPNHREAAYGEQEGNQATIVRVPAARIRIDRFKFRILSPL